MTERLTALLHAGGPALWVAVTVGIWAWAFHIVFLSSIAEATCARPGLEWLAHLATLVTGAATAGGLWACRLLVARSRDDEAAGTVAGRSRFLGVFGLLVNGVSIVLIALEGAYVPFLDACA